MPSPGWRASRTSATSCGLLALAAWTAARRGQRDLRLFLHRGEDDGRMRARDARDTPESLGNQLVEARGMAGEHLEEIRIEARHAVAREGFVDLADLGD